MNDEIRDLRKELTKLEYEFQQRVKSVEDRIRDLEKQDLEKRIKTEPRQSTVQGGFQEPDKSTAKGSGQLNVKATDQITIQASGEAPAQPGTRSGIPASRQNQDQSYGKAHGQAHNQDHVVRQSNDLQFKFEEKQKPPRADVSQTRPEEEQGQKGSQKSKVKKAIGVGVVENIAPFFGPLAGLLIKLVDVYRHYKTQGKAPVFFMTIAGIITLVLGFGYLLQYSFAEFLNEAGKVGAGFLGAIIITIAGIRLTRKHPEMAEYASSLIGLGIILNYLCAYFMGSYYGLIPHTGAFALLIIITGAAYFLALAFKTRVVAIISLIGGSIAPLMVANVSQSPVMYLGYLFILVFAMLQLARRIQWQQLTYVSIIFSFVLIEYALTWQPFSMPTTYSFLVLVHAFFYLFSFSILREIRPALPITRKTIILLCSNIVFFIFLFNQVSPDSHILGGLYFVNMLLWLGSFFFCYKIFRHAPSEAGLEANRLLRGISLIYSGLFAGVGILALSSPALMGMIWGIEGLMLLYMGGRFKYLGVRLESYIIIIISLVLSSYQVFSWVGNSSAPSPELLSLSIGTGWLNLIVGTAMLWTAIFLMEYFRAELNRREKGLLTICNELISFYLSGAFLLTIGIIWSQGIWLFGTVPLFYLIYRSRKKSLVLCEWVGLAHLFLFLVPVTVSAGIAGNMHFFDQIPIGKIARIEAFLCLWLVAEFYKRFYPESHLREGAQILRIIFFCVIPVFFLPSVWRRQPYFFPLAFWGAAAIGLFLYNKLRYSVLRIETLALVYLASLGSVIACGFMEFAGWEGHGTSALLVGLVFYGLVIWFWKGLKQEGSGNESYLEMRDKIQGLFPALFYYLGITVFILCYGISGSASLAGLLMLIYFIILFSIRPVIFPLKDHLALVYSIAYLIAGVMVISHLVEIEPLLIWKDIYIVTALACTGMLVYREEEQFKMVRNRLGGQIFHLWVFHCLVCLAYISLLSGWFDDGVGPAVSVTLVLHALIILFQTLTPRFQKLVWPAVGLFGIAAAKIILWDMSDFSLVQKIVAFLIIGALLLAAAYQYQKMRKPSES